MNIDSPARLLVDQLRDLYSLECQSILTFPELASSASDPFLAALLSREEEKALARKKRLCRAASLLGDTAEGDFCKAMQGLVQGGNAHISRASGDQVLNLILIAHVSRIFHYGIAGYGFTAALAKQLDQQEVAELIDAGLQELQNSVSSLVSAASAIFPQPHSSGAAG